jgi:hypothetical protein
MITYLFWFPRSAFLRRKWWHKAILIAFLVVLLCLLYMLAYNYIFDPYNSCTVFGGLIADASQINCGHNAFDFWLQRRHLLSSRDILWYAATTAAFIWLPLLFFCAAYRTALWLLFRSQWKDRNEA